MRFAIFASTNGTDLPAILTAAKSPHFGAVPVLFITNKPDCGARKKAIDANLPIIDMPRIDTETREKYDERLAEILEKNEIDFILLVGWMRLLSAPFIARFRNRILNVHPSLLPKFPGMHAIADALAAGETETGATIHFVDEGEDTGPILLQKRVPIFADDDETSLKKRVQAAEQELFPEAIRRFARGEFFNLQSATSNLQPPLWQSSVWERFQNELGCRSWRIDGILIVRKPFARRWNFLEIARADLGSISDRFWDSVLALAKAEKSIFVRVSPIAEPKNWPKKTKKAIGDPHPRATLTIDLLKTEEEILAQMSQKGRYNIRLAQKKGVIVERSNAVADFLPILAETTARDGFRSHSAEYFETMLALLSGAVLLLARLGDEVVAGGIFVFSHPEAVYYYGASGNAHREIMAPYLVQWEAIREAKKQGCTRYDFLGIAEEGAADDRLAGVTEFKRKFGGATRLYPPARQIVVRPFLHLILRFVKRFL